MRFLSCEITNFMGIDHLEVDLDAPIVVLVGGNASGKSSLLKALRVLCGPLLENLPDVAAPAVEPWMRRHRVVAHASGSTLEHAGPLQLDARAMVASRDVGWSLWRGRAPGAFAQRDGRAWRSYRPGFALPTAFPPRPSDDLVLPVLCYFGARRTRGVERDLDPRKKPEPRVRAYSGALESTVEAEHLLDRWSRLTNIAYRKDEAKEALNALEAALAALIPGATDVRFDHDLAQPIIQGEDGEWSTFDALSDGYRNVVEIGMDIALRAQQLNPQLGADAITETPGVVIIDEIDQHLHPSWQAEVLPGLRLAFPNVQFIVATHSPFVAMTLPDDALLYRMRPGRADESSVVVNAFRPSELGTSVDAVLRGAAFGPMVTWSPRYLEAIEERAALLNDEDVEDRERKLAASQDRLTAMRDGDPPGGIEVLRLSKADLGPEGVDDAQRRALFEAAQSLADAGDDA